MHYYTVIFFAYTAEHSIYIYIYQKCTTSCYTNTPSKLREYAKDVDQFPLTSIAPP